MQYDEYFLKFSKELAYLDLKKEGDHPILRDKDLPLPIRTFDLLEGIEKDQLEKSIDLSYFLKGMIWNLGIDPDFKYAEKYKEILKESIKEPDRFASQLGMDALKEGNLDHARIAFRAAIVINPENLFAKTHLAQLIFNYALKNLEGKDQKAFILKASSLYEEVLSVQEDNLLANTGLAQLNENLGHFLKAQAYYQRALEAAPNEDIREEVRQAMENIQAEVAIEEGIYYLNRADYDNAIHSFNLAKKDQNRYDVYYYLGTAFQNIENYEQAANNFKIALDKGGDFEDIYNGLVYNLNALGRLNEALAYANVGLKRHPSSLRIRFNRAILYAVSGQKKKALEDIDFLLGYADLSDEFFSQVMSLREELLK